MTKEQEILLAAEQEFLKNGYDDTSTAVIARNAGVTHAMVNYYYRSKEQLFVKVLDGCLQELLERIKVLMRLDGDFVQLTTESAEALFDCFLAKTRLPFLLIDIARTHPVFLEHYRQLFKTLCEDSIRRHSAMLNQQIRDGKVVDCSMGNIFDTVVSLAVAPFLNYPVMENILGMSEEQIDGYLQEHRAEMVRIIRARYSRNS